MPEALSAVISLSPDIRPNAIRVATNTAIGTANARIHAKFKKTYSIMMPNESPFPKNLSMALSKKFVSNTKISTKREIINGYKCSFNVYRNNSDI